MKLSTTFTVLVGIVNASRPSQAPLTTLPDNLNVPGENTLQYCADPTDYILSIDSLDLSPNPPVPGQNLTITANGKLSETVEEGKVHITVKWGFISLINKEVDLCENANMVDKECPLTKGSVSITKTVAIPKVVPKGKYVVTADALTKDEANGGKKIICMTGNIHF